MPSSLTEDHPFASVLYAPAHLRRSAVRTPSGLPSGFSRRPRPGTVAPPSREALPVAPRGVRPGIYPRPPCALGRGISNAARCLPLRTPASVITPGRRHGSINPFPVAYGCYALGLGPANPTRTYLASEPLGFRRAGFPPAFSLLIPASALPFPPRHPRGTASPANGTLPYQSGRKVLNPRLRRRASAPVDCRRAGARPVSCYALFQGWLLLSQPPGCPSTRTSLHTQPALGGLSRRSRLFPSRRRSLAPAVSLPRRTPAHSAFAGGR